MMNGHVLSSHDGLFGLGRRLGSESSSEEQLYSCSSSSDASVYLDVEPYFGDVDFHTCSGHSRPLPVRLPAPISQKYIAKAAQLVGNLCLEKKTKKEEEKESRKKADVEEFMLFDHSDDEFKKDDTKLRRASSLKTPGSPPPPGEKKIVRFADVLGLDLADVRTFLDEVPKVPRSAFRDLEGVEVAASPPVGRSLFGPFSRMPPRVEKSVVPLFRAPCPDFMDRLRTNGVCLESASVVEDRLSGLIRVVNYGFHKTVTVRTTQDSWKSHSNVEAQYVPDSCDGFSDKFSFTLLTGCLCIGDRMEFAICYTANGSEHWDNNCEANYVLQCVPGGGPIPVTSAYLPPSPAFSNFGSFY